MARYSVAKINRLLLQSDTATTTTEKGRKLEELVKYLFEKILGVEFYAANVLDGFRAHELDVTFKNDLRQSPVYFLGTPLITECKNTSSPVGSSDVGWFASKLRVRPVTHGVLIALSGITGEADRVSSAHREVLDACTSDKRSILVIDRREIRGLRSSDDLVSLLERKHMALTLYRTIEL